MNTSSATASLALRHSKPLSKSASRLPSSQVKKYLAGLSGWKRKGGEIAKTFPFKNYYETMAFVNAIASISHREDHHPDLEVGYNKCRVRYSTHSVGGLSENDFICAAKIETLMNL